MNEGLIPRRYAKALYLFANEHGKADTIYGLMKTLAVSFEAQPALQTALANPFIATADKAALIFTATGTSADKAPELADFIKLLDRHDRLSFMHSIALAYLAFYREERGIYVVNVESAAPLSPSEESRLKELISRHLKGGKMEYSSSVRPELIGGFKVSVGNDRIDASVSNELKQLRLNLIRK